MRTWLSWAHSTLDCVVAVMATIPILLHWNQKEKRLSVADKFQQKWTVAPRPVGLDSCAHASQSGGRGQLGPGLGPDLARFVDGRRRSNIAWLTLELRTAPSSTITGKHEARSLSTEE